MKRLSRKKRLIIVRLNIKHRKQKQKQKQDNHTPRTSVEWLEQNSDIVRIKEDNNSCVIEFPKKLNFGSNYDESAKALIAIRKILSFKKSKYTLSSIELDAIEEISTSASLVLTAEIDKWNHAVGHRLIPETSRWNDKVLSHMTKLGFFELCSFENKDYSDNRGVSNLEIVKFIKGSHKDVDKAKELRKKIEEVVGKKIKRPVLFQALSEAITNVAHHAYPKNIMKKDKYWYMTASFCSDSRQLKVAFYDQGVGIPTRLPSSTLWERAKGFMSKHANYNDHPSLIEAAVEMGRSKTDEDNRGKGLQDLLDFIKQYGNGYLSILSQKGLYKFECIERKSKTKKEPLNFPILGTLIIWCVTIPETGGYNALQHRY
jgi:hypothetical protein